MINPRHWDHETLRKPLEMFSLYMEQTLRENDHKGGWGNMSFRELIERAREELDELEEAIDQDSWWGIREESADAANFCMMIHDKAYNLIRHQALRRQ